jgi:type II restriction enzyme
MRDFDSWLKEFRDSISDYRYYIDFMKVKANAEKHCAELHLLNSLIGKSDIEKRFVDLVSKYPSVISAIPILLAVRNSEIYAKDDETGGVYYFEEAKNTLNDYCVFMRKTGLFDLMSRHLINNLYDYVIGIETGLDSNGRKKRGGSLMENLVESHLKKAGVEYYKEFYDSAVCENWGVDLSSLTNNGKTRKRFDFVVHTDTCVYGIETNFYASNGSKLNETARSYKMLALEARGIKGFKFVWFTDGAGWKSARQNLRETFEVLPTLYNIRELEDGIMERLFI